MISHVLNTDMLTLFQHGHPKVTARCAVAPPGSLAITVVSVEEQFLGWHTRARQAKRDDELASAYDRMTEFASFIRQLPIVSFTAKAIERYRQLKALKLNVAKKEMNAPRRLEVTAHRLYICYIGRVGCKHGEATCLLRT
jgi:tRNA(fMet)-specific endonuclease VapC